MREAMLHKHGSQHAPGTHIDGTKTIDGIFPHDLSQYNPADIAPLMKELLEKEQIIAVSG